jgi:large subunit ribosomal protein L29
MMKSNELRSKKPEELKKSLVELFKEQFNLRMQRGLGQTVKPHLFKRVRKDIARVYTIIRQKERQV